MAKKAAEIINGFKIPGGRGGAAVLRAVSYTHLTLPTKA